MSVKAVLKAVLETYSPSALGALFIVTGNDMSEAVYCDSARYLKAIGKFNTGEVPND